MRLLRGGAKVYARTLGWRLLAMISGGLLGVAAPLHAEPWHIATFTLSEAEPTTCENCLPGWTEKIDTVFNRRYPMNPGLVTGYIVVIDLSDPKLEFMMRPRDPSGACQHYVGPVAYTNPARQEPLPIRLMTVPDWAHGAGTAIVFSGSFFKYDGNAGVRAKNADYSCGEVTGLYLRNGVVEWPPKQSPGLLREPIDSVSDYKADAILFYPDRTAAVRSIDSFNDPELQRASYGFSGIKLYVGDAVNPTPGT